MRIIAGKYKGRKLVEFELGSTRPTSDKIREALFDKIGMKIVGSNFLDLFAGTGACGIEAISRNAKTCFFVDQNKNAVNIIKKNLNLIKVSEEKVLCDDYKNALCFFKKNDIKFDIIFLDPPYASDFAEEAIEIIKKQNLLSENGLVIWEHDAQKNAYIEQNFVDFATKKYGDKFLTYLNFDE